MLLVAYLTSKAVFLHFSALFRSKSFQSCLLTWSLFLLQVHYIQYIRELPSKEARQAEMAVLTGNYQDAENILLQAGLSFRAILLNIYLHQWEKALDLAIKQKTHVDTVLAYRIKHLNRFDKDENIKKFQQYMNEVEVDWEKIASKIEAEFQKENKR